MHVRIGKYKNFFIESIIHKVFSKKHADSVSDFLCGSLDNPTWFKKLCDRLNAREIYVYIDPQDVWNMDSTLKYIIHPMLLKLKDTKQGSGYIDDGDVPEHLRSTAPGARDGVEAWDIDHNFHLRYTWFLDEVIWAFDPKHTEFEYLYSKADQARINNGYRLFGKYYCTLWN